MTNRTTSAFRLLKTASGAEGNPRLGKILGSRSGDLDTPAALLPTRRGAPTHLTPDQLEVLGGSGSLGAQVCTSHFLDFPDKDTLNENGFGIHHFAGLGNCFVLAILLDSLQSGLTEKSNTTTSVHVDTPSGCRYVDVGRYMDTVLAMKPDMFVALSDDVNSGANEKRLDRSLERTKRWTEECLIRAKEANCHKMMLAPIMGGISPTHRRQAAESVRELEDVVGFAWTDLGTIEDGEARLQALRSTVDLLPLEKLRYAAGIGTIQELLHCIAMGVDLVDSSFVEKHSVLGLAYTFPLSLHFSKLVTCENSRRETASSVQRPQINLQSPEYAEDEQPILAGCSCMACQEYSRSYIHHLLQSNELLGDVLLQVHNFHHIISFMSTVRASIAEGTFGSLWNAWIELYPDESHPA